MSPESLGIALSSISGTGLLAASGTTWQANNLAYYYPFTLYDWATAYQLLFFVGATASGNVDVGIYDSQKHLVVSSGSTAMGTANTVQQLNIADTVLAPGDYLLGVACSSTSGTSFIIGGFSDENLVTATVFYEEASALPLPATCAPVVTTRSSVQVVVCGIQFVPTF